MRGRALIGYGPPPGKAERRSGAWGGRGLERAGRGRRTVGARMGLRRVSVQAGGRGFRRVPDLRRTLALALAWEVGDAVNKNTDC